MGILIIEAVTPETVERRCLRLRCVRVAGSRRRILVCLWRRNRVPVSCAIVVVSVEGRERVEGSKVRLSTLRSKAHAFIELKFRVAQRGSATLVVGRDALLLLVD